MDDFAAQLEGELGISKSLPRPSENTFLTAEPAQSSQQATYDVVNSSGPVVDFGVKHIEFPPGSGKSRPILTQSQNGACSILALINILSLRNELTIPCTPDKPNARLDFATIASLLINHLLASDTDFSAELDSVLALLPDSSRGVDVNPGFASPTTFKPAHAPLGSGSELTLFKMCKIKLVHGWCVERDNFLWPDDYESVMDRLALGTELEDNALAFPASEVTTEDKLKIQESVMIKLFMETYATQMTQYGLQLLKNTALLPGELVAFLRNNHINTLYMAPNSRSLYVLVTDESLRREKDIVWESVVDIDGNGEFVDENFRKSSAFGGDIAGMVPSEVTQTINQDDAEYVSQLDGDQALAISLQEQENARGLRRGRNHQSSLSANVDHARPKATKVKKVKEKCVVM